MRLDGPTFADISTPQRWIAELSWLGYSAVYSPVDETAPAGRLRAYAQAASDHDIVIAAVGARSNPISRNADQSRAAITLCQRRLALAEALGALLCQHCRFTRRALGRPACQ